jgi:preprotein translocase subunit SecF
MKVMIALVVVFLIGYAGLTGMKQFKTNGDFATQIEQEVNFVDENSMDSVKQDLVNDAKKLGIELKPDDVHIKYEDTEQRTEAQHLVGNKLDVTFVNKFVTITVDYVQPLLGIPFHKEITESHIRQIQAPRKEPSPEMKQLLDGAAQ